MIHSNPLSALHERIEADRQSMLDFVSELVAIPSENPPGNSYERCTEAIQQHLRRLGFQLVTEGQCLIAYFGDLADRTLYFSGHYDVVPAQAPSQFEPVIRGKNLFGRGSSDMKSGLAAMIYAMKAVRDCGVKIRGRIGLVFVPDEETAGPLGSRYLEEKGLLGAGGIGMLTPEPTGGVVWNANRGALTVKVTVHGKAAHVGRQFEGINAFENMVTIVNRLDTLKREVEKRKTQFEIQPERARNSILMMGGQSIGGTNFNVVPDLCSFTVDRRINPEEEFHVERNRLIDLIRKPAEDGILPEIEILQEGESAATSAQAALGKALAESIMLINKTAARFEMCPGLLETRFYARRGIPAYAYGPGLLSVSHGPREFVPIQNIFDCAEIYAFTACQLLTDPAAPDS